MSKDRAMTVFADMLFESRKEYLSKYADQPGVKDVLDRFWSLRHRISAPKNDIDWWIKKPYGELKAFVDGFDARNRQAKRRDEHIARAEKYGAKKLGETGMYEVWYIPSHEAAQEIGRMYKGKSASWCISTESSQYFDYNYKDSEFVFMVLRDGAEAELDGCDKIALQTSLDEDGAVELDAVWDIRDSRIDDGDEYDGTPFSETETYKEVYEALGMFEQSRLNRTVYREKQLERIMRDPEQIKNVVFKDAAAKPGEDGSWTNDYGLDDVCDLIDGESRDAVSEKFIRRILDPEGDLYDIFYSPDEPSFEYMRKAEKAFEDAVGRFGVKWDAIEKAYEGDEIEGLAEDVQDWMRDQIHEDFYGGNGYGVVWRDCWENGTVEEARKDIVRQISDKIGATEYNWQDGVFVVRFKPSQIRDMAKMRLAGNDENALRLSMYENTDDDAPETICVYEPQYGWDGFDEDMMAEAAASFGKRLAGRITMQKDAPGQMFFSFDSPDNPDNMEE